MENRFEYPFFYYGHKEYIQYDINQGDEFKNCRRFFDNNVFFPETYLLPNDNEEQIYKQIGNSVCVPVVSRIAEKIVKVLDGV